MERNLDRDVVAKAAAAADEWYSAAVRHVRSHDPHVYFVVSAEVRGWANLGNSQAFAICAAAAAVDRDVKLKFADYNPAGSGSFGWVQVEL